MSGRIETFTSEAESSKWSRNKDISVVEAGVDIGSDTGGGSDVSVDQVVTEGREVAGITVDGERTPILIPNAGEWTQSDWAEDDPADDAYIKNKPNLASVATSGSYADLSNTPDLSDFVEDANYVHTDYNYDLGAKTIVDGVSDALAGKVDKVQGKTLSDNNYSNADKSKLSNLANVYGIGSGLDLDQSTNILSAVPPTIDSAMSNASENAVQNKVITAALDNKVDKVSGKVLSDNNYTTAEKDKLAGIDNGAEVNDISSVSVNGTPVTPDQNKNVDITIPSPAQQVQSDWTEDDPTDAAYIAHKPTLGTAAAKDIPASGDASATEVVMGDDSRLTDARNAADVYSWAKASTKPSYTATEVGAIASTEKGANNGVAELDSSGKVPSSQLPSYVDDVLEYSSTSAFPATGESGKIYIALDTNKTYRWGGSGYVEISESLALGETSSTAYRGDRGKTAYDHSQLTSGNPHNVTASDVGLGNVGNFKAVSTVASQGLSSTEQANARANIGAGTSSFSGSYNDLTNKPNLATVATSGSYSDLSNKPSIPTKTSDLTNDSGFITGIDELTTAQENALIALLD